MPYTYMDHDLFHVTKWYDDIKKPIWRYQRNHYYGTFLGFYVVSFVQNLGGNSFTPSEVPETAHMKIF